MTNLPPPAVSPPQNFDFDTGFAVQGAVGTRLPMNFRTELEVTYRENDLKSPFTSGAVTADSAGDLSSVTVMANVIYDFQLFEQFKLFAGGGIGVASIYFDFRRGPMGGGLSLVDGNTNRFAYQAIAGASFEIVEGVSIFGKYAYLGTAGDSIRFNNAFVGPQTGSFDYHNHTVFGGISFELGSM
ncbi:MAG: outer membrane beta-barrel protein [Alphaproteobacteria bacterium]|nr:outer membrane beta-barrel protein [Alphaproteobacteria bacterium]